MEWLINITKENESCVTEEEFLELSRDFKFATDNLKLNHIAAKRLASACDQVYIRDRNAMHDMLLPHCLHL